MAAAGDVFVYGLTTVDAERLIRFAASAAEEGILTDDAAWRCGFNTDREEPGDSVVQLAERAAAYIKEHGL